MMEPVQILLQQKSKVRNTAGHTRRKKFAPNSNDKSRLDALLSRFATVFCPSCVSTISSFTLSFIQKTYRTKRPLCCNPTIRSVTLGLLFLFPLLLHQLPPVVVWSVLVGLSTAACVVFSPLFVIFTQPSLYTLAVKWPNPISTVPNKQTGSTKDLPAFPLTTDR